jgi:hypothetical protein
MQNKKHSIVSKSITNKSVGGKHLLAATIKDYHNCNKWSLIEFSFIPHSNYYFYNVAINLIRANYIMYITILCTVHCDSFTSTCSGDKAVIRKTYFKSSYGNTRRGMKNRMFMWYHPNQIYLMIWLCNSLLINQTHISINNW